MQMFIAQARIPSSLFNALALALAGCLIVPALACRPQEAGGTPAAAREAPAAALNAWEGITYDPATPADRLSMTPLKFEGAAEIGRQPADLVGDFTSWIAGVTALGPGKQASGTSCRILGPETDRRADCDLTFVRFGNFGRLDKPKSLSWALDLELQPGSPNGNLRAAVDKDGSLAFPANVRFVLPLVLMVQEEGASEVVRLHGRPVPVFEGTARGWPQGLMVLALANGPIQFFREGSSSDSDAEPYLVLKTGTLAFADKPSEFFRRKPVVSAQLIDSAGAPWKAGQVGGVAVSWTGTAREVLSSRVTGYSVYRKQGEPGTWQRIASVPSDTTSYLDKTNDGKSQSEYIVVHTMEFPFNRKYEGLYGSPAIVKPVVR
jgi:hypothetical protein